MPSYGQREISPKTIISLIATLIILFIASFAVFGVFENVASDEIVVIQYPTGGLKFVTAPGPTTQAWGRVTTYPKRSIYEFETQVRFNDGGHGTMKGSIQYEMPTDKANLYNLHTKFGSADAIQKQLIEKVVNKSVYMTGPLMSSKESYAEKRNYLISYVEDQVNHGVYRTVQKNVKVADQLTGQEKSAVVVEVVTGSNGQPERQEEAVLSEFGIKTFNFSINSLTYDDRVEAQIQQQQQITMDVQTAIANARKAEQQKLTVEQQGAAEAAKARWDQEVIKAKEVTAAQQRLEVAKLDKDAAEQYKQKKLLEADADATYRKRVMEADGALQQRLDAQVKINQYYADALKSHPGPWVPSVVMGGQGSSGSASDLINLLTIQAAKSVGLKTQDDK